MVSLRGYGRETLLIITVVFGGLRKTLFGTWHRLCANDFNFNRSVFISRIVSTLDLGLTRESEPHPP